MNILVPLLAKKRWEMAALDPVRAVGDVVEVPGGGEEGAVARLGNLCFEKLFYVYFVFLLGKLCVSHL